MAVTDTTADSVDQGNHVFQRMGDHMAQEQIIAEIGRRLSVIAKLEAAVEANRTRADRLRQSILSQAFNGKLLSNGARG